MDLRDLLLGEGAHSVKIEECVHSTVRARAPELARAKSLGDKLNIYWEAKGIALSPERRARLLRLAQGLEAEVRTGS
jgi:hypothetical protein